MSVIDQVLSILSESKQIDELPTATSIPSGTWAIIWNPITARAEKVAYSTIQQAEWLWIEGSHVRKGAGNTSVSVIEAGDVVWFKPITNAGDPLTLVGYTYDAGDKQLLTSYTQNQAITT